MAEFIACLTQGKVLLLLPGQPKAQLAGPYLEPLTALGRGQPKARMVGVTRGRIHGELWYAIRAEGATSVYACMPGSRAEQRLFQGVDAQVSELDFSLADEALACTVAGEQGASWLGLLADDGKGVRTVTEGDVVDRSPRWVPGGRGEIVYASAGIGRTSSGAWAGLAPSCLHRLRFADNSVEVLVADAKYDYLAPVPISAALLYALRRSYERPRARSVRSLISRAFPGLLPSAASAASASSSSQALVRITPLGTQVLVAHALAFDVAANGDLVYASEAGVFRIPAEPTAEPKKLADLAAVEQLVICDAAADQLRARPS